MNKHYVVVYGSLRRGFHNNTLLTMYDSQYVGIAHVANCIMHSLGGFPMVVNADSSLDYKWATNVEGELWLVSDKCLETLDNLEGHPDWYRRTDVSLMEPFGKRVQMYIGTQEYVDAHSMGVVCSADWKFHRKYTETDLLKNWKEIATPKKPAASKKTSKISVGKAPMFSWAVAPMIAAERADRHFEEELRMHREAERLMQRVREHEIVRAAEE